jgi:nitrite reductase/ring-hydroxylating ferredoxin subunit
MRNGYDGALPDGTRIDNLVKLQTQEVLLRVYADPDLHALEMERIFGKSWLLLAHETEIPKPGDFVVRHMGQEAVIVSRTTKNEIRVSLNVCPHRGMRVCIPEAGNAQAFRCVYHGWSFGLDGQFAGAPVPSEQMHGNIFDKSQLGLRQARVTLYAGLVFATWNIDGPSLEEFLGDIKFYLDTIFDRSDDGIEVVGPPQRFVINANWKVACEQFACDGYHALSLHQSTRDLGLRGRPQVMDPRTLAGLYAVEVAAKGHSLRCVHASQYYDRVPAPVSDPDPMVQLGILPPVGFTPEMVPQLPKHLSPGQLSLLAKTPPSIGGIFPNAGLICIYRPKLNGFVTPMMCLHTFTPLGPNRFEFMNWYLAEKQAPHEMKEEMLRAGILYMGTTGMVESDDAETWPHIQANAAGAVARNETLKYQACAGENKPKDWPGGGSVYAGFSKDDTQWQWWKQWGEAMTAAS